MSNPQSVAIVGAGLAGTLLAIFLARRGHPVDVFERNGDLRLNRGRTGRSVNLTLVERGLACLDLAGVGERVRKMCVPAHGRRVHINPEVTEYQPYGDSGEALHSISRAELNRVLLDAAEATRGVHLHFRERCASLHLDTARLTFENLSTHERHDVSADLLIGADGVRSVVRTAMQQRDGFNFSQFYSSHSNKELDMPARSVKSAGLATDALHIWPRGEMMLIGFPNPDGSITCTMHMPSTEGETSFAAIKTPADLAQMFQSHFSDAIALIPNLMKEFFENSEIPMVTIRCSPWIHGGHVALIGDAAHAVWPSYGQGANAAFEDCAALNDCLAGHGKHTGDALAEFQALRKPNTDAIADLSENHFTEIRSLIRDPAFLHRKKVERKIHQLYPKVRSLYELVAFTRVPYAEAVRADGPFRAVVDDVCRMPELCIDLDSPSAETFIRERMERLKWTSNP